jgi:hypothetical protein
MRKKEPCKRVLLADAEGCRIMYCEACEVAELEFGAMSIRLETHALYKLQATLGQAIMKHSVYKSLQLSPDFHFDQLDLH